MCVDGGGGLSLELAKRAGKGLERVIKGEGPLGSSGAWRECWRDVSRLIKASKRVFWGAIGTAPCVPETYSPLMT